MIARFANPHLLIEETETVSRAAIDANQDLPHSEVEDQDDETLATLQRIIKRSLGDFHISQDGFNASPEPKRKRRRVESVNEPGDDPLVFLLEEPVPFRLVSGSTTLVSLKPKPSPVWTAVEPSYEDDDAEATLRAKRAADVAVDGSNILKESLIPAYPHPNPKKVLHIRIDSSPIEPLMVVELQKEQIPHNTTLPSSILRLPERTLPNPHTFPADGICCPVHTVDSQSSIQKKKRPRRRHHMRSEEEPHPPSFWRAPEEWGGKSAGYAFGYHGSRPIPAGRTRQWVYRRDKMRKGIFSV